LPFDLVVFDLDGVLVDSEPIANRVLAAHLARLGVPVDLEATMRLFTGLSLPSCYALVRERFGIAVPDGFTAALQAETFARYRDELRPVPGVVAALARIALPKCVASSSEPEKIRLSLELTGLGAHFNGYLFSALEVARGKPHPDLFLHAARRMGAAPARTAVVEDSLPGIAAGRAAGMTVFAYGGAAHADRAALGASGARLFDDMAELPALLAGGCAVR
jgi:HAD superfamily hydrolase (TIGR01509 family)